MRTTVTIDDNLLEQAQSLTGVQERATLIRMALEALVEREAAHRLAKLGATERELKSIPRQRT